MAIELPKIITVNEFVKQVKKIEGFDIRIKDVKTFKDVTFSDTHFIKAYPYKEPYPDNKTVDEFIQERVLPCFLDDNLGVSLN